MTGEKPDLDLLAAELEAPTSYFCPICFRVLRDPVTISSGHTYDRQCIENWLAQGNNTCPVSGLRLLEPVTVVSNVAQRGAIEDWCQLHMPHVLDQSGSLPPHQTPTYQIHATSHLDPIEEDFAIAVRLQEDELEQYSARQPGTTRVRADSGTMSPALTEMRTKRKPCISLLNLWLAAASFGMVAVYILSLWQGKWQIQSLSQNPLVGPDPEALSRLGSKVSSKMKEHNQWWRLVTSLFVSSGVIHLFSAVTSLWTLAKYLEISNRVLLPGVTIPAVYLISGVTGCIVSANMAYDHMSSGASAAVCGLLGMVWMEQLLNWRLYNNNLATVAVLTVLTGMFAVISLLPLVGFWFQIPALISGALLAPCVLTQRVDARSNRGWICIKLTFKFSAALVVAAAITVGVLSLVLNDAKIARSCHTCLEIDCAQIRDWWSCNSLALLQPQASCLFDQNANATTTITCPSGYAHLVATSSISNGVASCNTACSGAAASLASPVAGPNSAGVLV